jgi:hypothetical protein
MSSKNWFGPVKGYSLLDQRLVGICRVCECPVNLMLGPVIFTDSDCSLVSSNSSENEINMIEQKGFSYILYMLQNVYLGNRTRFIKNKRQSWVF